MDQSALKGIGLTEGEIKVYLALIDGGSCKTGQISRRSGVHTSKVYPILDRLISKGLASYIIENNVKIFQTSDPKQLLEYVKQKRRELEEQESEISKLMPELYARQKLANNKQSAQVYEGLAGIKALFEIMLDEWQPQEEYLAFSPGDEFDDESINRFFKKHHLKRVEKGVIVKVLALESQREFYKKFYAQTPNMVFRYTQNSLPAALNIVHNKVSTLVWRPIPTAFVIDSESVSRQYRDFFNRLWEIAKD